MCQAFELIIDDRFSAPGGLREIVQTSFSAVLGALQFEA